MSELYDGPISHMRRSLLDSADSYPPSAPENRLTEIFAEVVRTSPDLLRWLVCKAFGNEVERDDARALSIYGSYKVETQFSLRGGSERPDMQISLQAGTATGHDLFYIENKFGAAATAAQLNDYPATGMRPVIVILPEGQSWPKESRFVKLTWTDVARQVARLGQQGRGHANEPWPDYAMGPDVPSQLRMLAELARYLEGLGVNAPRPLTGADLDILPRVLDIRERWDRLLHLIEAGLERDPGLRERALPFRELGRLAWELRLKARWPALERHWQEQGYEYDEPGGKLIMAAQMSWAGPTVEEPSIGVGITVLTYAGWPPGLGPDEPYQVAAERADFRIGTTWSGRAAQIMKTKPMREFASEDKTLDEQAESIVTWARDALAQLETLKAAGRLQPNC
jgi:hypothetical protein